MALTTTGAFSQILEDSDTKTVVLLNYHANTAVQETDVLKVNAAALSGRTVTLASANTSPVLFTHGEPVSVSGGANGHIVSASPGSLTVVIDTGTFGVGNTVIGGIHGNQFVISSVTVPEYLLAIRSAWWSITGADTAKVELTWRGNGVFTPALTLSGVNGYIGPNQLGSLITNRAANPRDGNIYITTHGLAANGGYSIMLELRKGSGYAQRPIH